MQLKFWRWILPVLAGLALAAAAFAPRALAQSPTEDRLASLMLYVWPEYDQPSVLVQYDGEVAAKDKLPRDISVLIPSSAQLNATAYIDANSDYINTDPATKKDLGDGWTLVTFKLPVTRFHLEYYYNPLQGSPDKKMDFLYKAYQPADNVQLEIQQPLKATNFVTDPAAIVQSNDPHGFVLHRFNYATLDADKVLSVKLSYTKSDPSPSTDALPKPASASTSAAPSADSSNPMQWAAAGLIALALALAALGGFYWWSRNRPAPAPITAAAGRSRRRGNAAGGGRFCTQCGRALASDDNFCPRCGAPRRKA